MHMVQGQGVHLIIRIYAFILGVFGVALFCGGIYLIFLGGSFYYALAGAGLAAAAVLMWQGHIRGVWLYLGVFAVTLAWAIWEVGFSFWPLVPRLIAPIFMAAMALFLVPLFSRDGGRPQQTRPFVIAGAGFALLFAAYFAAMFWPHAVVSKAFDMVEGRVSPATVAAGANWSAWGKTGEGARFAAFDQITPENVKNLQVAWTARTGFIADDTQHMEDQNTPLFVDGTLFQCAARSQVTALDGVTGEIKWQYEPGGDSPFWKRCRTLGYFDPGDGDSCGPRIIVGSMDAKLHAIRVSDGTLCDSFGEGGKVDLLAGLGEVKDGFWTPTTGPTVAGDKIVIGSWIADNVMVGEPSGAIRAFDATSGEQVWAWDLGNPEISNWPPVGETYTRGTPNMWSAPAFDLELGMIYLPLGNATPDYFGGMRRDFDDDYNASLVALRLEDGREVWHFKTVNHDIWDYDLPSQPALADVPDGNGGSVPAVIQTTKRGQIFVLDRRTGTPVKTVEERPVPNGDGTVEGEYYADTQPFSTGMHAIGGAPLSEARMWGATPLDQMLCRIMFRSYRYEDDFTTQSLEKSIVYPGNNGGMNWGSASIDQSRNLLIAADMRMPVVTYLIPRPTFEKDHPNYKGDPHGELSPQFGLPYAHHITNFMSPIGIPCLEPPWGTVSAVNLASGELVWQQPAGTARDVTFPGTGIQNPLSFYIGMPALGGVISTIGGVAFHSGTQDYYLRAYDVETGELLWKGRLPSGSQSTPMTYLGEDGRQYIAVTAGGARYNPKDRADYIVAFALPDN